MALVQAQSVGCTGSQSSLTTPSITTTAKNLLLIGVVYNPGHTGAVNLPTSSQSDTFARPTGTNAPPYNSSALGVDIDWFTASAVGGATTFSFSWTSATSGVSMVVAEFSGRSGSLIQAVATDTGFVSPHTLAAVTALAKDDVIQFISGSYQVAEFSASAPWSIPTNGQVSGTANTTAFSSVVQANVSAGVATPTVTSSSNDQCAAATLSLTAAPVVVLAMAQYFDRISETSNTAGTGPVTLAGAQSGYRSFASVVPDQTQVAYCIVDGTAWETGYGTFTLSGTILSRDVILASSIGGTAITLSGSAEVVFLTAPAAQDDWQTQNESIATADVMTVPAGRQLIMHNNLTVLGSLTALGDVAVL